MARSRPRCCSTPPTWRGSATPSPSRSTCKSRRCARWKPAGRCYARPTPAPPPSSTATAWWSSIWRPTRAARWPPSRWPAPGGGADKIQKTRQKPRNLTSHPVKPAKISRFSVPATAAPRRAPPTKQDAHISTNHIDLANLLGQARLRPAPALRYGSRRRHLSHRDLPARHRPGTLARRLRAAVAPPQGWPLRRKPEPHAALLPISGGAETGAGKYPRPVSRLAVRAGPGPAAERRALRRGRLGKPDAGRLGPRLGSLAERDGGDAVHLLPAGRRPRLQAGAGRDHLWHRAAGDVSAGRRKRL